MNISMKLSRSMPTSEKFSLGTGLIALAITLFNLVQFYMPRNSPTNLFLLVVFGVVAFVYLRKGIKPTAEHIYRTAKDEHGRKVWFKLLRIALIVTGFCFGVVIFLVEVFFSLFIHTKLSRSAPTAWNTPHTNPDWQNPEEMEAYLYGDEMPASAYLPKYRP
tara:strand:- start:13212 stop:13697 length:486 start_codon:yes stop_codon:yes gene_type:complete